MTLLFAPEDCNVGPDAAALLLCRAAYAVVHPREAEVLIQRALEAARTSDDLAARRRVACAGLRAIDHHAGQPWLAEHERASERLAAQRRVALTLDHAKFEVER